MLSPSIRGAHAAELGRLLSAGLGVKSGKVKPKMHMSFIELFNCLTLVRNAHPIGQPRGIGFCARFYLTFRRWVPMNMLHSIFVSTAGAAPFSSSVCVAPRIDRNYLSNRARFGCAAIVAALQAHCCAAGYVRGHHIGRPIENHPDVLVRLLALNGIGVSIRPINPANRASSHDPLRRHRHTGCGSRKRRQPGSLRSAICRCSAPRSHASGRSRRVHLRKRPARQLRPSRI
ncbi:hypothetical protein ABIB87_005389 [Bradyrhizobium sp. JR18.2]